MCTVCLYVHMFFPPGSLLRYAAADETADYVLSQNWLSLSQNGYGCVCEYIYIHMYVYIYIYTTVQCVSIGMHMCDSII